MRTPSWFALALCLGIVGCGERIFGVSSWIQETPSSQYRVWWEVVEGCSGRKAAIEAVSWFRVPAGTGLSIKGETAAGAWFADGNRIAILDPWKTIGPLVRHEMLHAILRTGSHPREFFEGKCADEVICGRDCMKETALPGAIPVAVEAFEVSATMYPLAPSIAMHDGRATIVVSVRNPTNADVFISHEALAQFTCSIGYEIRSVSEPAWAKRECGYLGYGILNTTDGPGFFRPGETRRLIFDTQLARTTSGGPFHDGLVTVTGIFANSYRRTQTVLISP